MRWLDGISVNMNLSKLWETVEDREACSIDSPWGCRVGHNLSTEEKTICITH